MTSPTLVHEESGTAKAPASPGHTDRLGPLSILIVSGWCGLVAGLLEVGITIVRKRLVDSNHFYWMSRHFVWLVPLSNLLIFLALGVFLSLAVLGSRRGYWFATRVLAAMALLPLAWAAFPRIYGIAGFLFALGAGTRIVGALERRKAGFRRLVWVSFPVAAGLWGLFALLPFGADRVKEWREESGPLPRPNSPNLVLIVLDTVGASHLSLYGYDRAISPTISELATRGISFDRAQATSPWTLPSHASMFTGRWPHEVSAGWLTPLDEKYPTLAQFLGSSGYATAGFTANYAYCASDSGLARGFTRFQDYVFPELTALQSAVLVDHFADGFQTFERFVEDWLDLEFLRPASRVVWQLFKQNRKGAATVNRQFIDWLSGRRQAERPFFAFLNYYDAHQPYQLSDAGVHRVGVSPRNDREIANVQDWVAQLRRGASAQQIAFARDAYDDCIADLDEQLGMLIDELEARGILNNTWLIIAADHGENFNEHPGVFLHGGTLYQTERHVPLVIVPPAHALVRRVVHEPVSLRDLPATIVDFLGVQPDSPFPGTSLARFWNGTSDVATADLTRSEAVLSEVVPLDPLDPNPPSNRDRRWPLGALTEGNWTYIRREGEVREELFDLRSDSGELHNLAGDPAVQPMIERMRKALHQLTGGPLTPEQFSP
jgi:arylsulfatase A-like enzyme